jgi:DNA polymerase-3 subunit epsilon
MRQVVIDLETTGLRPGVDKIVEIGCVEVENYYPTGKTFHTYVNPGMKMPKQAEAIHGITDKKLKGKPKFWQVKDAMLEFIGPDPVVAHNARFDISFLSSELDVKMANGVIDTLELCRKNFGSPLSLDAVLRRFDIKIDRTLHGALIDAKALAQVYVDIVGRQHAFDMATAPRTHLVLDFHAKGRAMPVGGIHRMVAGGRRAIGRHQPANRYRLSSRPLQRAMLHPDWE